MARTEYSKIQKVEALQQVLHEAEERSATWGIPFLHHRLPGRKRDLFIVARKLRPELADTAEGVLERYMGHLAYKFPPVNRSLPYQDAYRKTFPECFR